MVFSPKGFNLYIILSNFKEGGSKYKYLLSPSLINSIFGRYVWMVLKFLSQPSLSTIHQEVGQRRQVLALKWESLDWGRCCLLPLSPHHSCLLCLTLPLPLHLQLHNTKNYSLAHIDVSTLIKYLWNKFHNLTFISRFIQKWQKRLREVKYFAKFKLISNDLAIELRPDILSSKSDIWICFNICICPINLTSL